jgi:hypothetical protein
MDDLSATPHNNAVYHYCTHDNGHGERLFYGYEIVVYRLRLVCGVSVGRLREKVLLKESPASLVLDRVRDSRSLELVQSCVRDHGR